MIENIDIGGPTLIRAAAKNHHVHRRGRLARELRRGARGAAPERRPAVGPHAREPRARGLRATPPATTRRSRAGSPSARRTSPRQYTTLVREGARPSLRREPAPAGRLLRRGRRAHAPAVDGLEAARQGAVVQQPARPRRRAPPGGRVRAAGRRRSSSTTTRAAWPCGAHQDDAFELALATDRQSAYGGVFCFNRRVERALAEQLHAHVRGGGASRRASTTTRWRCCERSRTCGCSRTRSGGASR